MLKRIIIVILLYNCFYILPQNLIKNYNYSKNKIKFSVVLKPTEYVTNIKNGLKRIQFINFFDESKPGSYSLPKKEFFISLPAYSKVTVNVIPKKINKIQGIPKTNPALSSINDSSFAYDFKIDKIKSNNIEPLYKVDGYLWIRNYYCVQITVNQYRYNNNDIIEELNEMEVELKLLNPENSILKNETTNNDNYSKIILNKQYAVELDRKYYDKNNITSSDWINFNETYLKLGVSADGVYRISKQDLIGQNISANSINPQKFNIILKGKTVPIYVKGENDGVFDDNDFIEFFGYRNWGDNYREISAGTEPYKNYLNRYSDTAIYWLTLDPLLPANRIDSLFGTQQSSIDTLNHYTEVVHYEQDNYLDYSIPNIVDRQNPEWVTNQTWIWGLQGVGTANRDFLISDVVPNLSTKAYYKVQSYASDGFVNSHKIGLSINNNSTVYDSTSFNKYQQKVVEAGFNSNLLSNGSNTLKTISYSTSAALNSIAYDWYEVEYPRYLNAINDSLKIKITDLNINGIKKIKVNNINTNNIVLYKFSGGFKRIVNFTATQNYLIFSDSVKNGDSYFLIAENKIQKPKYYYKKKFEDIVENNIQAEYILITHPKFISKSNEYLSFIKSNYNVNTKLINVFDIYDQFYYGFFSPEPIRDFLHTAYLNWQSPKPKYVFLVGDATYDYYGNKTKYFSAPEQINYVPSFGEPVSDAWFTVWDTTGAVIPQLNISRLPVNSNEEYEKYFNILKDYVSKPFSDFNKKYLLLSSGQNNNPGELALLKAANDFVDESIVKPTPTGGIVRHLYKITNPIRNFGPYSNEEVKKYIGEGGLFISYIGHSGTQIWDNGITSPTQLKNVTGNNSLISDWGCSTGKFAEPDVKAFSELFIAGPDGDAINYNGNSSLGFTSTATLFPKLFYSKILSEGVTGLAEAHTLSKINLIQQYGNNPVNKIFVLCNTLFGDPIVSLKVPHKPNLTITENDVKIISTTIDDSQNLLPITFVFNNLGNVENRSYSIKITDTYKDSIIYENTYNKNLPLNIDSVISEIPIQNLAGVHLISFTLDVNNEVDELNENDNTITFDINVASASIRALLTSNSYNQIDGTLRFLNPTNDPKANNLEIELSDNSEFNNFQFVTTPFDIFFTEFNLKQYINNKRVWLRSKIGGSNTFGSTNTFFIGDKNNYLFHDSISFNNSQFHNIKFSSSNLQLDSSNVKFNIVSAGLNDGNAISIEKNNQDYVTSNTERGHFIAVFKNDGLNYVGDYHFDIFGNAGLVNDYINLLDTLDNSYLVLFGVKDEGSQNLTTVLKNKIKEFGSIYIDSLAFRNSWAMIGRKGSAIGSVPESFTRTFEGKAIVDTTIEIRFNSGNLVTPILGPVTKWNNINIDENLPAGTSLNLQPIGIKNTGGADTLSVLQIINGNADLSGIDAKTYPQIKMNVIFNSSNGLPSPELNKLEINYGKLSELGLNFQTVDFNADSISAGENINSNFSFFNAGYSDADSVNINIVDKSSDGILTDVFNTQINISKSKSNSVTVNYTAGVKLGQHTILIYVDKDNLINEIFKDNNLYSLNYIIKADSAKPELNITFDGLQIINNDFVSADPEIKIELLSNSSSPINDTSVVTITLNNKPIYFSNNVDKINYSLNPNNPKFVLTYKPHLNDGNYSLKVTGKSNTTPFANETTAEYNFTVTNSLQLLNVYNYPNPFSSTTYFTFKLTAIPEELKIKIFTIAGRLVKQFDLKSSELNYDFNRINWDGRDEDGDLLANGVYLYKIITSKSGEVKTQIQKLTIVH